MELEYIRQNYARMSDAELQFKLVNSFKGLRSEVVEIIISECEKRGLPTTQIEHLKQEAQVYDENYIQKHKQKLLNIPCPVCNTPNTMIGGRAFNVVGVLRYTRAKDIEFIACKECLKAMQKKELINSLGTGWWSFGGFANTLRAIRITLFQSSLSKEHWSEKIIRKFIIDKNIALDTAKNNPEEVSKIVGQYNQERNFQ